MPHVNALTVSPARVEPFADPGGTINDEFTLINEQDQDQTFFTSIELFDAQGETGTPNFKQSTEGIASWIKVQPQVLVKAGEKVKVPYQIIVPQNADTGGHFAAIFLSTVPPSVGAGEVSVGAKIGMLVLLRVSGEVKEGGGLLSFMTKSGSHFASTLPITFTYRFNNVGGDRVNPQGKVIIKNVIGMNTAELNANPTAGNVLPNSTRKFETTWGESQALPSSAGFLENVKYQWNNFALGFYTANLNLNFGSSGVADSSYFVVVLPWHLMTVIVVILIVLVAGFRQYNKFIIKKAKSSR